MTTPIDPGAAAEQGDNAPGPNPAWNDVLSVLPEQFHEAITPHFQQWDQAAQQKIEAANSKVKEFEPYSQFVEHGIDSEELENGLRLMYEINSNPQAVYDALAEAYNLGGGTQSAKPTTSTTEDDEEVEEIDPQNFQDPRYDELQQNLSLVNQVILEQNQEKMNNQADAELDNEMSSLKQAHGEFNEEYVLAMMMNGKSGKEAVEAFQNLTQQITQNNPRPFAPTIMGTSSGGAGLPSNQIDPTKLTPKETRNLVAEMIQASAKQNR